MNPSKIGMVIPGNERGGAATHILTFAQSVREAGAMDRFAWFSVGTGPLQDALSGIAVVTVLPSSPLAAYRQLVSRMSSDSSIRLWHAHGPRTNVLVGRAARRTSCGWTSTIHSHPRKDFLSSRMKSWAFTRLNVGILRSAVGLFVGNPAFAEEFPGKQTYFVPNAIMEMDIGMHVERDEVRRGWGITPLDKVVGMVARFDPVKDIPTVLRAVSALPNDVHLVLAGDGAERFSLQQLAEQLGISARVHFLGFLDPVRPLYTAIDVLVLASLSEGASPFALLEAGWHSIPVVSSDIPAIRSVIQDGVTGRLFPVGHDVVLAERLAQCFSQEKMTARMAEELQRVIRTEYTPQGMLDAYSRGYSAMLGEEMRFTT